MLCSIIIPALQRLKSCLESQEDMQLLGPLECILYAQQTWTPPVVSLQPIPQLPYQCKGFPISEVVFLRYFIEPHPTALQFSLAVLMPLCKPRQRAEQTSGAVQVTRREEHLGRLRGVPEHPWLCLGTAMNSQGRGLFILIFPFAQPLQCPWAWTLWCFSFLKGLYATVCGSFQTFHHTNYWAKSQLSIQLAMSPRGCNSSWAFARHRITAQWFPPPAEQPRERWGDSLQRPSWPGFPRE